MKKHSIVLKIGISMLLYFFLLLLPLSYAFYQTFISYFIDYNTKQMEYSGYQSSFLIGQALDRNEILDMCENISRMNRWGIKVFDKQGDFIYSAGTPYEMNLSAKDVSIVLSGQTVKEVQYKGWFSPDYVLVGIPVQSPLKDVGFILLYDDASPFHETQQQFNHVTILAVACSILLSIGVTYFLSHRLGQPLVEIYQAIRDITTNKYKRKSIGQGKDEIFFIRHALNELGDELNRYQSTRNDLLENISHEIRTPLTYIQGYSVALQQGLYVSKEEMNEYLKTIENETKHILRMVDDLMDVSQIENGQLNLEKEICDLNQIINETVTNVIPRMHQKNIRFSKVLIESAIFVNIDPVRMKQVIFNLVDNAIRYSFENGSIAIECSENGHEAILKITDQGIGIKEEELALIWERFYRAEKSRDKALGGVGLGLPIVKQIVDLHEGRVEVFSRPGVGSTFMIILPKYQETRRFAIR